MKEKSTLSTSSGNQFLKSNRRFGFLLVCPAMIYLLLIMLVPFIWAFSTSMTGWDSNNNAYFIGFQKYAEILRDPYFFRAIQNTLVYTLSAVVGKVFFGVIMALILNKRYVGRSISRALMLLPWTIPTVISILTWRWLFSDVGGPLDQILRSLGLISAPVGWLSGPVISMASVILVNVWRGAPFIGISVLAGLQTIDENLYEAAIIDGANFWQKFWNVTIPHIAGVIAMSALVTTIWTFNDFEIVWLLTRGGPAYATELISTYSYRVGFGTMDISKAIAVSVIILPFLLVLVHIVTKRMQKE